MLIKKFKYRKLVNYEELIVEEEVYGVRNSQTIYTKYFVLFVIYVIQV